ncbi:coiled-coil and C2 domain-containing protein 1-like [Plutella xylostella]|uniref:coiled-coil and C2 domain-containing protein 1-like n=1 Tax=Plutella xylostella TaxID=51655 RepID=UPI00203283AF|nr:coiled-coil and C2 domain-containing protein 1-like [Plutella xylostella]
MARRQNPSAKKSSLSQYGLLDLGMDDDDEPMDISDDDIDLEAELAAISGGGAKRPKTRKLAVPAVNLDAMIAESLKDIPSDEEDGSDDDDPDLLNELQELTVSDEAPPPPPRSSRPAPAPPGGASSMVTLLNERIANYTLAESNAKAKGESSRARRFSRGLKTLNDLLKQAKAGRPINEEDIPPPVSTGQANPAPSSPPSLPPPSQPPVEEPSAPEPSLPEPLKPSLPEPLKPTVVPVAPVSVNAEVDPEKARGQQIILKRKAEFKAAALAHKQTDKPLALELLKVVKQFDMVLDAYNAGTEMDLGELPTPDAIIQGFRAQKTENEVQHSAEPAPAPMPEENPGLITASTVEEALKQRLAVFQEQESKAKEQGNASKARRMGRIVKQYTDAIRLHSMNKPFNADELPTPPGFAPLPLDGANTPAPPPAQPSPRPAPPAPSARPAQATRADKQLAFLLQRQKEFREAALKAKKNGNIAEAKEYLRAAIGFDSVLEAARGGLAVDLKSLPVPPSVKPQLENTFDIVSAEDCEPPDQTSPITLEDGDVITRLQQQLNSQLKLCLANRDHYKAMGNVAETNRFEHLAVSVKQDLDVVAVAKRLNQDPPKFHYESKHFSVIQCNTDLNENDLELTIVRGIAYNVPNPKEVDTYVKFEFPYPPDVGVTDKTPLVKDSNSPAYGAVFPLAIQRAARPCTRVFKRHALKLHVYSSDWSALCCCRGWFSKDALLGTVTVKLAPLESQVTLHEAFPLMDGRRPAGGSLEVKLRVRTPILQQQFDNSTHRWLVIDN